MALYLIFFLVCGRCILPHWWSYLGLIFSCDINTILFFALSFFLLSIKYKSTSTLTQCDEVDQGVLRKAVDLDLDLR